MATLIISYFGSVRRGIAGDPIKSESLTTSTSSAASGAIPANAAVAMVASDTAHYVTMGTLLGVIVQWLPTLASVLTLFWTGLRIYVSILKIRKASRALQDE